MSIDVQKNKNKELVAFIIEKLKKNDWYCPCRLEKTPDTKCMCLEFRQQIERGEAGECHCGLYEVNISD